MAWPAPLEYRLCGHEAADRSADGSAPRSRPSGAKPSEGPWLAAPIRASRFRSVTSRQQGCWSWRPLPFLRLVPAHGRCQRSFDVRSRRARSPCHLRLASSGMRAAPTSEPASIPPWAAEHPHVFRARRMAVNNTLYVASRGLRLPSVPGSIPGGGVFPRQALILTLTALAQGRSLWRLPGWFYPTAGRPALSYHSDPRRWKRDGADCYVQSVGRGQEFVLDCDHFPEAFDWLRDLFAEVTGLCADQAGGKRRMRHVSS